MVPVISPGELVHLRRRYRIRRGYSIPLFAVIPAMLVAWGIFPPHDWSTAGKAALVGLVLAIGVSYWYLLRCPHCESVMYNPMDSAARCSECAFGLADPPTLRPPV